MQKISNSQQHSLSLSPSLLAITVFFAAGICWAAFFPDNFENLPYIILLLAFLIFLLNKFRTKYNILALCILFCSFFLLTGFYHAQIHFAQPSNPNHIFNHIKTQQTVSLYGILAKHPSVVSLPSGEQKTHLLIKVKGYLDSNPDQKFQVQKIATGLVLLTMKNVLRENLKPGDHFLVKSKLTPLKTFSTPGAFNYKKHLRNQGIMLKGWIDNPRNIIKVHSGGSYSLKDKITSLLYLPERIRNKIATFVDKNLDQPARGLYKAILIGDRSDIEPRVLEKFIKSGCIHILAISGMHMGLLFLVIVGTLTWLFKRSSWLILKINILKAAICFATLPLIAYALIAGFNTPVIRALLMALIFIIAVAFDRPGNLINHIFIAALIILIWKPSVIFTASFQLSFSAVASIGIIYPILYSFLFHNPRYTLSDPNRTKPAGSACLVSSRRNVSIALFKWVAAALSITGAAMLGTFPILLFHFNRISLAAPLANLMVEPLICIWSLLIGIVACLLIPIAPMSAKVFFHMGSFGLTISEKICGFFSALEFSSLRLPTPTPFEISIYYIFLLSLVMVFYLDSSLKRPCLKVTIFSFCSLLAIPAISEINRLTSNSASISVLDVGHGSAVVLQLPHHKNILIDGGSAGSS
jgi:competence protein ComEC